MEIVWLGHACFRLRGRDAVVLTDPFSRSIGFSLGRPTADVVTISHDSPFHSSAEAVAGSPRILRGPGEYEVKGAMIAGVATPGEKQADGTFAKNTAYTVAIDEVSICHLGVLGKTLTTDQIDALQGPDVLLVPVGGGAMLSPGEAAEVISQIEPKLVIPMMFSLPGFAPDLLSLERFAREMGLPEESPQARLSVTRSSLPDVTTVVVLEASVTRGR